jgi:hypothetical protein
MGSNKKKKTTMAKLNRETALRERRADKQARKDARKRAAQAEASAPSSAITGDGGLMPDPEAVSAPTIRVTP